MVERFPRLSTRRMASRIGGVPHMLLLRALHETTDLSVSTPLVRHSLGECIYQFRTLILVDVVPFNKPSLSGIHFPENK